jgi:hypothetical protein
VSAAAAGERALARAFVVRFCVHVSLRCSVIFFALLGLNPEP